MKKLISLAVSLLILSIIFYKIDLSKMVDIFRHCSLTWMGLGAAMFIPATMITAFRFKIIAPDQARISYAEALKLVLAGSSLNMVLPSKMGDIAKGYFVTQKSAGTNLSLALSLVVYEKACDVLSLLLWCVLGLIFYKQTDVIFFVLSFMVLMGLIGGILMIGSTRFALLILKSMNKIAPGKIKNKIDTFANSWISMCTFLKKDKPLMLKVAAISIAVWFLHLVQIWFFIRMLNATAPFGSHLALTPLAIFAGLLPLTYAGIGTRDAALIYFLKDYLSSGAAAALGILCTMRYIVPALAGLPFLNRYMFKKNSMKRTNGRPPKSPSIDTE
ncbi:MAG: flippase-like domain-containing protein [Desulfobacteraceae bacterium]|nr:flippase-like domain-containing protein [Desulfobacteraceae bacterium]